MVTISKAPHARVPYSINQTPVTISDFRTDIRWQNGDTRPEKPYSHPAGYISISFGRCERDGEEKNLSIGVEKNKDDWLSLRLITVCRVGLPIVEQQNAKREMKN